jgi:hypothetical protein
MKKITLKEKESLVRNLKNGYGSFSAVQKGYGRQGLYYEDIYIT